MTHGVSLVLILGRDVGNCTFMTALDAGCASAGYAIAGCATVGCASAGCARTRRPKWSTYALLVLKGRAR